jgi:glycosyltransferase involved in cell wall biosynthesis
METQPRLSIGIPVYNGERFLGELLINLLHQTFQDFEIVICDNASTDCTQELCLEYVQKEPRIRYHRNQRNLGAIPNFNKVFVLSRAPLFKWAAHDDLYDPSFLGKCVQILDENPDVVVVHSDCVCVDELCRPFVATGTGSYVDPRSGYTFKLDPGGLAEGCSAMTRFWDVLFRMRCNMPIFGVIRRRALARTRLQQDFYGSDKLVLAELALLGRFAQIREKLYMKRFHQDMSWALSIPDRRKWSNNAGTAYSLRLRQLAAFSRAPLGKGLSNASMGVCLGMVSLLGPKVMVASLMGGARKQERETLPWRRQGRTTQTGNPPPFPEVRR